MGLFSSIGGLFGGNSAGKGLEKSLKRLQEENRFKPFNLNSPLSSGNFDGSQGGVQLGAGVQNSFDLFNQNINQTGQRAANFDPQSFQNEFFQGIDRLESQREAEGFDDFESSIFNKAGVSSGSQRQVRDFQESLQQRRFDRSQRAVQASQQFQGNLFNQFLGLTQGRNQLNQAALQPLQFGGQLNAQAANINNNASQFGAQAADARAVRKANTGSAIGGIFDGALSFAATGGLSELTDFFGGGSGGPAFGEAGGGFSGGISSLGLG